MTDFNSEPTEQRTQSSLENSKTEQESVQRSVLLVDLTDKTVSEKEVSPQQSSTVWKTSDKSPPVPWSTIVRSCSIVEPKESTGTASDEKINDSEEGQTGSASKADWNTASVSEQPKRRTKATVPSGLAGARRRPVLTYVTLGVLFIVIFGTCIIALSVFSTIRRNIRDARMELGDAANCVSVDWEAWPHNCSVICGLGVKKRKVMDGSQRGLNEEKCPLKEIVTCSETKCPVEISSLVWTPWRRMNQTAEQMKDFEMRILNVSSQSQDLFEIDDTDKMAQCKTGDRKFDCQLFRRFFTISDENYDLL